jgi:hypothetical protein
VAGRIRSIEKIHLIGTRSLDLLACSIVPQQITLPRAPLRILINIKMHLLYTYISALNATSYLITFLPHYMFRPYAAIIRCCLSC